MPTLIHEAIPPKQVYPIRDIDPPEGPEPVTAGWERGLPIAIDIGTHRTRVGYAVDIDNGPQHNFYTALSKYRDRKAGHTCQFVGNDVYLDSNSRQNIKVPFDTGLISNWEQMETLLDYSFAKINVQSEGKVDNPLVMTEMLACPMPQRRTMNEMLFESYHAPSVVYGVDSLFSHHYNQVGPQGLVVSAGNDATNIIPIVDGKGVMSLAKRVDWGGKNAASLLQSMMTLKYPTFPSKLSFTQASCLMYDHCYVSQEYEPEVTRYLEWEGMQDRERVVEFPYTPNVVVEKSEEELARIAEKKRENGRRLQEQAAKARLEKLIEKENNLNYYQDLQQRIANGPKRDIKKTLDSEGFKSEEQLQKVIDDLNHAIRRARKLDLGDDNEAAAAAAAGPPTFPLIDIPDSELDEEQVKEKRKQKLMKANYDARLRAKEEKEAEKLRQEQEAQRDAEWRERDLKGWIEHRRNQLSEIFARKHEKQQLKDDLANRKSHASQMRMKNIAALASDSPRGTKRRRGNNREDDPDDTFGADDNDWAIYRDINKDDTDSEAEEEEGRTIKGLEEQLTKYDEDFRMEEFTREPGTIDWRDSVMNMFLRGPRPFDPEDQAQAHQMNMNIERIRVPEVLFEPEIVGLDSAGLPELCENLLVRQWPGTGRANEDVSQNIFLTGGHSQFQGFDDRLHNELRSVLPVGTNLRVVRANNAQLDAWKGMAKWATSSVDEFQQASVSRQEYLEMGPEYMKEHRMGNSDV